MEGNWGGKSCLGGSRKNVASRHRACGGPQLRGDVEEREKKNLKKKR